MTTVTLITKFCATIIAAQPTGDLSQDNLNQRTCESYYKQCMNIERIADVRTNNERSLEFRLADCTLRRGEGDY